MEEPPPPPDAPGNPRGKAPKFAGSFCRCSEDCRCEAPIPNEQQLWDDLQEDELELPPSASSSSSPRRPDSEYAEALDPKGGTEPFQIRLWREQMIALRMAAHPRLGRDSPARLLPPPAARIVASFLHTPYIFALGGYRTKPHAVHDLVEVFDWDAQQWIPGAAPMEPRCFFGAVAAPRGCPLWPSIIIAGGNRNGTYMSASYHEGEILSTCDRFDPVANCWLPMPSMTHRRGNLALVEQGGMLLAIGGLGRKMSDPIGPTTALASCEMLDLQTFNESSKWAEGPSLPEQTESAEAVVLGEMVYAVTFGGVDRTSASSHAHCMKAFAMNTAEVRQARGHWLTLPHHCLALRDSVIFGLPRTQAGTLCVLGGQILAAHHLEDGCPTGNFATEAGHYFQLPDVLDADSLSSASWRPGVPLEGERTEAAGTLVRGEVFVCGGAVGRVYPGLQSVDNAATCPMETLATDIEAEYAKDDSDEEFLVRFKDGPQPKKSWRSLPPMKAGRCGHRVVLLTL